MDYDRFHFIKNNCYVKRFSSHNWVFAKGYTLFVIFAVTFFLLLFLDNVTSFVESFFYGLQIDDLRTQFSNEQNAEKLVELDKEITMGNHKKQGIVSKLSNSIKSLS